jgi:hypothetical protein
MTLKRRRTDWRPGIEVRLQEQEKISQCLQIKCFTNCLKLFLFHYVKKHQNVNVLVDKKFKSS